MDLSRLGSPNGICRFRHLLQLLVLGAAVLASQLSYPKSDSLTPPKPLAGSKYNVVLILTDDEPVGFEAYMPNVQHLIAQPGVRFLNSFATTPLCCPSRAGILSGGFFSKSTGVLGNNPPNGGAERFMPIDFETLAVSLQQAGYRTGMMGKYLNGFEDLAPYVSPGWNSFYATRGTPDWSDYIVVVGSTTDAAGTGTVEHHRQYLTSYLRDRALEFIRVADDRPFFLYFAPKAPHKPATPDAPDANLFNDESPKDLGLPNYAEQNLSDKPEYVRLEAAEFDLDQAEDDEYFRNQLRSLQAVDRAVAAIVQAVLEQGKLKSTIFIYASDNGFMHGQHKLFAKSKPYEDAIRVPLVISAPGVMPRHESRLVANNLDIAPTVVEIAGATHATEGRSLVPLLVNPDLTDWREELYIEGYGPEGGFSKPPWVGIRTKTAKFVEYVTGETELYDLVNDPWEMDSKHADPDYQTLRDELAVKVDRFKGAIVTSRVSPDATIGTPYTFRMQAWGGSPPYHWSLADGNLPQGLQFQPETGEIVGTPTTAQCAMFTIQLVDSSPPSALPPIGPQTYQQELSISVGGKLCEGGSMDAEAPEFDPGE